MNSGPFVGIVDAHAVIDALASYRMQRLSGATISLSDTTILNRETTDFLGAPAIGRLFMLRVSYEF